jgi:hypothetical protein
MGGVSCDGRALDHRSDARGIPRQGGLYEHDDAKDHKREWRGHFVRRSDLADALNADDGGRQQERQGDENRRERICLPVTVRVIRIRRTRRETQTGIDND